MLCIKCIYWYGWFNFQMSWRNLVMIMGHQHLGMLAVCLADQLMVETITVTPKMSSILLFLSLARLILESVVPPTPIIVFQVFHFKVKKCSLYRYHP